MVSEVEKERYLRQHLPYEVQMMRYAHERLFEAIKSGDQLISNLCFECFCLHYRVLYEFLTCKKNVNNLKATDFGVGKYPHEEGNHAFQQINQQISHLTLKRHTDAPYKIQFDDTKVARKWLEAGISRFINSLTEPRRIKWDHNIAPPLGEEEIVKTFEETSIYLDGSQPSATNAILTTSSEAVLYSGFVYKLGEKGD